MATSSLGRLTLDLAVRLSEFTDGMSRAERETANRTQRMQESVTSFREHLASELGGTQLGGIIDSFNERFGSIEGSITKVGRGCQSLKVCHGCIRTVSKDSKFCISFCGFDCHFR